MPYPQWVDPEIVYATDLNVLASQGIARFNSAAERSAAISVPAKGQVTWVDGLGYQEYDGSQWVPFVAGGRLLGGKKYPGTWVTAENIEAAETYGGMESGVIELEVGKRYAVDVIVAVSSTVANDTAQLFVREDDGGTHLTGIKLGFFTTHPLALANEPYHFQWSHEFDQFEDTERTYVVTARRLNGTGLITLHRRDNTFELSYPRIQVRELGLASALIEA